MTKPLTIVVDDSPFIQFAWQQTLGDKVAFRAFGSPEEFQSAPDFESLLADARYIVLDIHFDHDNALNGIDFAREIRSKTAARIIVSSDAVLEERISAIDCVLPKSPLGFEELMGI